MLSQIKESPTFLTKKKESYQKEEREREDLKATIELVAEVCFFFADVALPTWGA